MLCSSDPQTSTLQEPWDLISDHFLSLCPPLGYFALLETQWARNGAILPRTLFSQLHEQLLRSVQMWAPLLCKIAPCLPPRCCLTDLVGSTCRIYGHLSRVSFLACFFFFCSWTRKFTRTEFFFFYYESPNTGIVLSTYRVSLWQMIAWY